jgi:chaperonin GroEL (HSP60 family)
VIVKEKETYIIGSTPDKEILDIRIKKAEATYKNDMEHESINIIKTLINSLKGKAAIVKIGGANALEKEELRDRYIDALCACQQALKGGIVTGNDISRGRNCLTISTPIYSASSA